MAPGPPIAPAAQKSTKAIEREIWLWDFAGQADYRLIHQLFMDETALAVLVFNPQSDNPFEGLGQWDHDLRRAARGQFKKLLVAGRCDRGGRWSAAHSLDAVSQGARLRRLPRDERPDGHRLRRAPQGHRATHRLERDPLEVVADDLQAAQGRDLKLKDEGRSCCGWPS